PRFNVPVAGPAAELGPSACLGRKPQASGNGKPQKAGAFGVTDPAAAGSATQDYRGEPPSGTPSERVRVALVAGSGSVATDDLYRLLRRRLLIVCTIVAVLNAVLVTSMLISSFTSPNPEDRIDLSVWFQRSWRLMMMAPTAALLAAILWRRPPRTVSGLRLVELIFIGTLAFLTLHTSNDF